MRKPLKFGNTVIDKSGKITNALRKGAGITASIKMV